MSGAAPKRIQRRRTKGWKMPEGAVYVGRPTEWGNVFAAGMDGVETQQQAVDLFRQYVTTGTALSPDRGLQPWDPRRSLPSLIRNALAGRDLACWCPLDQPCHADVLLELANTPTPPTQPPTGPLVEPVAVAEAGGRS